MCCWLFQFGSGLSVVRSTPDANHYEITLDAVFDNSEALTFLFFDNFKLLRYP